MSRSVGDELADAREAFQLYDRGRSLDSFKQYQTPSRSLRSIGAQISTRGGFAWSRPDHLPRHFGTHGGRRGRRA